MSNKYRNIILLIAALLGNSCVSPPSSPTTDQQAPTTDQQAPTTDQQARTVEDILNDNSTVLSEELINACVADPKVQAALREIEKGTIPVDEVVCENNDMTALQECLNLAKPHLMGSKGLEIINILINKGADINRQDKHGRTPMFYVADRGPIDLAKLLIGKGAKLDEYHAGWTPLHMAAVVASRESTEYDNSVEDAYEILKLLLDAGADPDKGEKYSSDESRRTPLKVVEEGPDNPNKKKVLQLLREVTKSE